MAFWGCSGDPAGELYSEADLVAAVAESRADDVATIMKSRSCAGVTDADGNTLLFVAALSGDGEVVAALLEAGCLPNELSRGLYYPLEAAVVERHAEVVDTLLKAGADPNRGYALGYASSLEEVQIVKSLLAAGADPNIANTRGSTPLSAAVYRNNAEIVKLLMESGADPTMRDEAGQSPIDKATEAGQRDIVDIIDGDE